MGSIPINAQQLFSEAFESSEESVFQGVGKAHNYLYSEIAYKRDHTYSISSHKISMQILMQHKES